MSLITMITTGENVVLLFLSSEAAAHIIFFYSVLIFSMEFFSFVHGRLPYENLKPDPVLRSLLLSLPIRKVVSVTSRLKL